ncbi:hypothetical protein LIER_17040 [Lithospermum erythrorhizon]|uniref:Transmembrane protein n=1 Tax=Lithospermum erythrorhizon TaxID=34254 RepID=A0AAV3QE93_LITER
MARLLLLEKQLGDVHNSVFLVFIAVLSTLLLVSFFIFSCAEGAKDKDGDATDSNMYGSGCAAGCGAACGG